MELSVDGTLLVDGLLSVGGILSTEVQTEPSLGTFLGQHSVHFFIVSIMAFCVVFHNDL